MNDDLQETEVLSFRITKFLSKRLEVLRGKPHHVNVSSYVRRVLVDALNRDYPIADAATLEPEVEARLSNV